MCVTGFSRTASGGYGFVGETLPWIRDMVKAGDKMEIGACMEICGDRFEAAQMKTAAAQSPVPAAPPTLITPEGTLYPWAGTYEDWVAAGKP